MIHNTDTNHYDARSKGMSDSFSIIKGMNDCLKKELVIDHVGLEGYNVLGKHEFASTFPHIVYHRIGRSLL